MSYRVYWDNGASACGVFPYEFDTFEEADAYGKEWADESNLRDFGSVDPEEGYDYEIIESPSSDNEQPKALSPAEFLEAMKACCSKTDTSISHIDSDELMENQLIALGFGEAIKLLRGRTRWYE